MNTNKNYLTSLDYEQCIEVLRQFDERYPQMRQRPDFLGMTVSMQNGSMFLKITITQQELGLFTKEEHIPRDLEFKLGTKKALLRVVINTAPILSNASPKGKGKFNDH